MKVLHVITGLEGGGAERMLERLVVELRECGIDSRIAPLRLGGMVQRNLQQAGFDVRRLSFREYAWIKEADLIQGWMYHGNLAASFWSRFIAKVPHVWNVRASWSSYAQAKPVTKLMMRAGSRLSSWPTRIVYNSGLSRREHEEHGFNSSRGIVIPNGFLLPELHSTSRESARKTLGLAPAARILLTVGRFHPDKDYRSFVEAVRSLKAPRDSIKVVMVGRGLANDNAELLSWMGNDSDLFTLMGPQENCAPFYQAADVFVLSSNTEAFPNVLGEAMSFGLPCVSTEVGDVTELLGNKAWICRPESSTELAGKLDSVLKLNSAERATLGSENRARIENRFALPAIANRYAQLYHEVVD